jgi:hypothetical protein
MSASLVDECHRRAGDARRSADMASLPSQKTHFLELEQRWLRAASSVAAKTRPEAKALAPQTANVRKRRPSKFTPETMEQIKGLIALGRSRHEIAGLLGVTVGTLQVTCSNQRISLRRRPKFDAKLDLPEHEVPYTGGPVPNQVKVNSVRFAIEQVDKLLQGAHNEPAAAPSDDIARQQVEAATLALTMHLRGRERTVPLHLPTKVFTLQRSLWSRSSGK